MTLQLIDLFVNQDRGISRGYDLVQEIYILLLTGPKI